MEMNVGIKVKMIVDKDSYFKIGDICTVTGYWKETDVMIITTQLNKSLPIQISTAFSVCEVIDERIETLLQAKTKKLKTMKAETSVKKVKKVTGFNYVDKTYSVHRKDLIPTFKIENAIFFNAAFRKILRNFTKLRFATFSFDSKGMYLLLSDKKQHISSHWLTLLSTSSTDFCQIGKSNFLAVAQKSGYTHEQVYENRYFHLIPIENVQSKGKNDQLFRIEASKSDAFIIK